MNEPYFVASDVHLSRTLVLAILVEIHGKGFSVEGTLKNIQKRLLKQYGRALSLRQLRRYLKELNEKNLIVKEKGLLISKETLYQINPEKYERRTINYLIALGLEVKAYGMSLEKFLEQLMETFTDQYGDAIATAIETFLKEKPQFRPLSTS